MKPMNITSSFSNREKMRRNPLSRKRLGLEVVGLALDLVQLGDQRHSLAGDLAGIELVRFEQLPAGVRHVRKTAILMHWRRSAPAQARTRGK